MPSVAIRVLSIWSYSKEIPCLKTTLFYVFPQRPFLLEVTECAFCIFNVTFTVITSLLHISFSTWLCHVASSAVRWAVRLEPWYEWLQFHALWYSHGGDSLLNPGLVVGFSLLSHYFFQGVLLPAGLLDSTYHLLPSSLNFHSTHLEAGLPDGREWDCLLVSRQEMKQLSSCHLFSTFLHCLLWPAMLHFWPALGWPIWVLQCCLSVDGCCSAYSGSSLCWVTCSNCFCIFHMPNESPS